MRVSAALVGVAIAAAVGVGGTRATPAEPEALELTVTLRHGDASKIPGGRITVLGPDADTGPPFAFKKTLEAGDEGKATFRLPKPGRYDVEAIAPNQRSVSGTVDVKDTRFPTSYTLLWAATVVVPVTVVARDRDGRPIEDARVRIARPQRDDDETKPPVHDATTDATGTTVLHVGGHATWTLTVRHPTYAPYEIEFPSIGDSALSFMTTLERRTGATVPTRPNVTEPVPPTVGTPGGADRGGAGRPPTGPTEPKPPTKDGLGDHPVVPPRVSDDAPADFAGRWRHVSGTTVELVQTGASVTGRWSHLESRLTGTVQGRTLAFTTASARGLECAGRVTLDAAGRAFFGEARVTRSDSDAGRRFHFDAERAK